MAVETLGKMPSDVVIYEEPTAMFSRDELTAGAVVAVGDLLKLDAATGAALIAGAADLPTHVALYAAASGVKFAAIGRHAVVDTNNLNWASGITAAQKAAQIANLSKSLIKVAQ